ncbi:Smt3-specific protease [Geranomyces variabilis]|uniref:Smt3-specific protease n=1 Tax=Geranomyces variabilis TaxID=109894 RepID=A0AAD5XV05_9FUNG|nr:Smt3-specific protease [Geranomyces variabilis]
MIDRALRADPRLPVAKKFNIEIRPNDLGTLRPGIWLNDEVINYYGQMVMARNKAHPELHPKVHIFNTFFYEKLQTEPFYENVRRWTKKAKVNVFEIDKVIAPLHFGNHWACGVINMRDKRIEYYDSLGPSYAAEVFKNLRDYVKYEYADKQRGQFSFNGWTDYAPKNGPRQNNGQDCGVFTALFMAHAAAGGVPLRFEGDVPSYWRRRLMAEILLGHLGLGA